MKRSLSDYLVALFVIACSVVLLGALTFALSGRQLKKPTRTLQINYEDVTGIKVNSEVRDAGIPPLPSDVTATRSSDTMLSPKFVAISAGTPGDRTLTNNASIEGHPA